MKLFQTHGGTADQTAQEKIDLECQKKLLLQTLGEVTLKDIIADLLKPGRDMRDSFDAPVLRQDVLDIRTLVGKS